MMFKKITLVAAMFGTLIFASTAFSQSELASAVMNNQGDVVSSLINQKVDINNIEVDGSTALHWAAYNENADITDSLIKAGADVEATNREGMTALIIAVTSGNAEVVEMLLDAGASVNQTLANGETPLMMAARTGDTDTIQIVLDRGADIDAAEPVRGTTALMWAAAYKNSGAVKLLLENGAAIATNSGANNDGRNNPYIAPTARSRIRGFYRNSGQGGTTLLNSDLEDEAPDLVDRITRGQLIDRLPPELIAEFDRELVEEELEKQREEALGASFEPVGDRNEIKPAPQKMRRGGLTALHFAVREGDLESAKALIEAGADVNQVSEYGWTPLLTATQNRYYQLGTYLIEQGANPNISNEGGWNALYLATDNRNIEGGDYPTRKPDIGHMDYIKLLLSAGADPNLRMQSTTETRTIFTHQWVREEGGTPFFRAAQSSDVALMKVLLEFGADPRITSTHGVTPLMLAAGIGWVEGVTYEWSAEANVEAIKMLLELGANPNAQDLEDGRTALMGAAHKGRNDIVQLLVDAGANLEVRDIGSRDSINKLAGLEWQAIDYADGLVRIGVQAADAHPETFELLRALMLSRGLSVPDRGRTLDSICIVDVCL